VVRGSRYPWLSTAGFYGLAALFMLPTVFVFYWMITLSLKPQVEAMAYPPSFVRFTVTTAILSFVFSWNNFLFSVILAGRSTRTLPIAVYTMISYEEINWGTLAAAATLITLPVLLVALFAQRHIVSGLTFGAVKQ
jgi:ABC-type glycerol-3-phosphate transport system permease component